MSRLRGWGGGFSASAPDLFLHRGSGLCRGPLRGEGPAYGTRSGAAVLLPAFLAAASTFGLVQPALLAAPTRTAGRAGKSASADVLPGIAELARQALLGIRSVSRDETRLQLRAECEQN
ncbi:hypothetical protein GCM10018987_48020 [Streptomyces cremeus]